MMKLNRLMARFGVCVFNKKKQETYTQLSSNLFKNLCNIGRRTKERKKRA